MKTPNNQSYLRDFAQHCAQNAFRRCTIHTLESWKLVEHFKHNDKNSDENMTWMRKKLI